MRKIAHPFRKELNDAERYVPEIWSREYVASRMIMAAETLRDLNTGRIYPAGYSSCFPEYKNDWNEMIKQATTPEEVEELKAMQGDASSKPQATGEDIMLMEEALYWPMKYLPNRESTAISVNMWIASDVLGIPKKVYARRKNITDYYFKKYAMRGLDLIAAGLTNDGVEVR